MTKTKKTWWKEGVVYQIYPRSFNDSNNDGIGDIRGIIEKLDYIKSLGVDIIWICPVYKSPNDDNGYDVSDYRNIIDEFGTMGDFDELLKGIHARGMRLLMDLVANHSSDEHHWFQEARKSKDNPYRDYYFWKRSNNGSLPTNWPSFFGGDTWEYNEATEDYYLHLFTKKQPDLNWENPKVRQEIYDIIKFWFHKGIDGFRMDVISLISKRLEFENTLSDDLGEVVEQYYANGPRIHEYLQEMNHEVLSKYDIMTVGEGPGITLENGLDYVAEDRNELNMIFHFDHMFMDNGPGGRLDPVDYDLVQFKKVFSDWDQTLKEKGWNSIFLGNHDFSRMVSRFGNDKEYHQESAKLLAMLLLTLRGTTYIYQGDEIGMTNVAFDTISDYRDVETLQLWKMAKEEGRNMDQVLTAVHRQSRDNARTPMQWSSAGNSGFSDAEPWIKVNSNYDSINVAEQEKDGGSVLSFYRSMIKYRKANKTLVYGDYKCIHPDHKQLYMFERWDEESGFMVVLNMSNEMVVVDELNNIQGRIEITNYSQSDTDNHLRPWEARLYKL
ncbi:MAG: alpha-glucosidase [Fulvivirga sp.]